MRPEESFHHFPDFPSRHLPHSRPVTVRTPPGYGDDPRKRYPVFYLHDGQNLFDPATAFGGVPWHADQSADRVVLDGTARPMILVGVGNSPDRLREYGPRRRVAVKGPPELAKRYGRFLTEELIPFIDRTFRTKTGPQHAAVGGSSMGGLISLHLCRWYPKIFGLCGAVSPSLWWDRQGFFTTLKTRPAWLKSTRIWLDMGGREGATAEACEANVARARKLAAILENYGKGDGVDFRYLELPNAQHNEGDWGHRFDQVLQFLFRPDWNY
jgi:predicted alpha/beta superfamily hydrolase